MSQGFGPFETMALGEKAGLDFVTIGINIRAETPETAADMMDYSFAPPGTTPMSKLRASDGHAEPYPATLVVELGKVARCLNLRLSDCVCLGVSPRAALLFPRLCKAKD
jgi:hypothetical protein